MDWLKKLQERYRSGKLTKEQYNQKVADGLEDEVLNQEEHDAALKFDPKAPEGGDLIYSQEDVNRIVITKSRSVLRKALKDAGIDLGDVDNKGLMDHVVNLVKGDGKKPDGITEAEVAKLRADAGKAKTIGEQLKGLLLENAVLKNASGKYTPVNANQVVRALRDYDDEIEYDDNDVPVKGSIDALLKRIAKAEPNLFKSSEDPSNAGDDEDDKGGNDKSNNFSGRPPGGGGSGGNKTQAKEDAQLKGMLDLMGIKSSEQK